MASIRYAIPIIIGIKDSAAGIGELSSRHIAIKSEPMNRATKRTYKPIPLNISTNGIF